MSFETYSKFFDDTEGVTLRPQGDAKSFSFKAHPKQNIRYRLFTVGQTEQFYWWKDEPDGMHLYRSLTDGLDTKHAVKERYCLDFSSKTCASYTKRIYKKIMWRPVLSYLPMNPIATAWKAGIRVTAQNLVIKENGFLQMRLDIYHKHEGVSRRSVVIPPDEQIIISIPAGTYPQTEWSKDIMIPVDAAHVGVFIEGREYAGECYLEHPFLKADGQNLLPGFSESVADKPNFDWSAQYVSRKEWPEFRVCLNGTEVFSGEVFERCHSHSEWEINLPAALIQTENTITYELISDYHDPLPYTIFEAGLIAQPDAELSLLAVSQIASVGEFARLLIRTRQQNTCVTVSCSKSLKVQESSYMFAESGLHGILLECVNPCENAEFTLSAGECTVQGRVERIVLKERDQVITGTGDMIYIHQDMDAMEEYLSWYLSNHIGNFVTIRPTYRWSGTRTLNTQMWNWFTWLMGELHLTYVLMADGREVQGLSTQPDDEMLAGKGFLGRQAHERDGAQYYWNQRFASTLTMEQNEDLMYFACDEDRKHTSSRWDAARFHYVDDQVMIYSNRNMPHDYALAHRISVDNLARNRRKNDIRHTGPSCMFKYLLEAGYHWVGAETMYTTMEPLMGFLRGVAKGYGLPTYGVHHALQWSSTPHECEEHYRRFRLALYVSYMLGATDINTEEGLWHLEEYYEHHHRFGAACQSHLKQQQDFFRYVSSHSRTGKFYTPGALIHGREDGVNFFSAHNIWGMTMQPGDAEKSWKLLTALYPLAKVNQAVYVHGCPTDVPQGYHSGTPYGNVDILPMEGNLSTFADYNLLVFMGYNHCTPQDATKLYDYVKQGGTMLLTMAHLTCTTDMQKIKDGDMDFHPSDLLMTNGTPEFAADTVNEHILSICKNIRTPDEVLLTTDNRQPLLCRYAVGKGSIYLFASNAYPAHAAIREAYEKQMTVLMAEVQAKEPVWIECGQDVEFSIYNQGNGDQHCYLLAVDWYHQPGVIRHAVLRLGKQKYNIEFPFGVMLKCVCHENVAAWAESEDAEVLAVTPNYIKVQGTGKISFGVAKDGKMQHHVIDFSENPVQSILISK